MSERKMNYEVMERELGKGAARQGRVVQALTPILKEILELEEDDSLWFSDMTLLKAPEGGYRFMVTITEGKDSR